MTDPIAGTGADPRTAEPQAAQPAIPYHLLAASGPADERTRVLKHGDTFAVFDRYGDIKPGGLGEEGLYHEGTRFLSCLVLELEGRRPFFLGSTVRDDGQLAVTLTNPDPASDSRIQVALGTLHLSLTKLLWQGTCHQQLRIKNHGIDPLTTSLALHFAADFADIFEVRGPKRCARGENLPADVTDDRVVLSYRGLDGVVRRTVLRFVPPPSLLTDSNARFQLMLSPQQEASLELAIGCCERHPLAVRLLPFADARAEVEADRLRYRAWSCHLRASDGQFNAWMDRALADLHMMATALPTGPYPYAGVPWFNTPFGRDGLITALECLWLHPELARGVLVYLAAMQATEVVPEQDAEPGKILHETRRGEMAALGEIPFGRYYGSVDATPLFVVLAGAYFERTGDLAFLDALWPHVEAALNWIDRYGDRDGDDFVEYWRQSRDGLLHQGWKDSDDAVFHADGSLASGPIALCEVQGYVYAARRAGAALAAALGLGERAAEFERQAETLRDRFEQAFWCEDLSTYALALDGDKRPCRVRSSNAGHCLFTGIARPDRARCVARTLLSPESFSGWGVRTIAASEARYNPMGYHTGAVWPHDNALIARGLARYGFGEHASHLLTGLFEASLHLELHRMPELFCGFPRQPGEGPVIYPVACGPQAWSAGAVFLLIQTCLGLEIDGLAAQVCFNRPRLPATVDELRIHNLAVANTTVDLLVVRDEHGVGVNVLRREGDVRIVVVN